MRALTLAVALCLACASSTSPSPTPATTSAVTPTVAATPATAAPTLNVARNLPLFDAHIHYSQPAWSILTPDEALARLAHAGVRRAIVSSSPDEGTMRLWERAPEVVVPFLRPYRGDIGPASWARDGSTVAYLESTYRRGVHRGIGEMHLAAGETALPVVRAVFDLAVREGLWLQIHTDARGIDEVMRALPPRTRVLWAHAGQSAPPSEIAALVARYPTMWVDLAGRYDIAPSGVIDEAWRDLLTRHAGRFMAGSDTWINAQWEQLDAIEARNQQWLAQLPDAIARQIASGNAEELFPYGD
jgi:hypothetical protein